MKRSNKYAFVPFCLICQGVRAQGIVRHFPACVDPLIRILIKHHINIVQMPCPELIFDGFQRKPCGRKKYDTPPNRQICEKIAEQVIEMMAEFRKNGCDIVAMLGIEFSPTCAVSKLMAPPPNRQMIFGEGIFIEALKKKLKQKQIRIPIIGVEIYHIGRSAEQLETLLSQGVLNANDFRI